MSTAVEALREPNLELQNSLGSKIDGLVPIVSRATLLGDCIGSEILFGPATGDALARTFRTELEGRGCQPHCRGELELVQVGIRGTETLP